jgi:hypothetical protein
MPSAVRAPKNSAGVRNGEDRLPRPRVDGNPLEDWLVRIAPREVGVALPFPATVVRAEKSTVTSSLLVRTFAGICGEIDRPRIPRMNRDVVQNQPAAAPNPRGAAIVASIESLLRREQRVSILAECRNEVARDEPPTRMPSKRRSA